MIFERVRSPDEHNRVCSGQRPQATPHIIHASSKHSTMVSVLLKQNFDILNITDSTYRPYKNIRCIIKPSVQNAGSTLFIDSPKKIRLKWLFYKKFHWFILLFRHFFYYKYKKIISIINKHIIRI